MDVRLAVVRFSGSMSRKPQRQITSRVIRPGEPEPSGQEDWLDATPDERIEAVWTLTKACMAWEGDERGEDSGEPRLQRSVTRVQRTWR